MSTERSIEISLPGEWALKKVLGPTMDVVGEDIKNLYARGREAIIRAAIRKIPNTDDQFRANLRVTQEVLIGGSLADSEICAEYFGGVLASSRSIDGNNDSGIPFANIIRSLSSSQLRMHYVFYRELNKLLLNSGCKENIGYQENLTPRKLFFSSVELEGVHGIKIEVDLNILHQRGLISNYFHQDEPCGDGRYIHYAMISPTILGVFLYSIAHNRLDDWRLFSEEIFAGLEGIQDCRLVGASVAELKERVRVSMLAQ